MGNSNDGESNNYKISAVGEDQVAKTANKETKLLIDVYNKLSKNGLNKEELETLKSLDKVLNNVELHTPDSVVALFTEKHKDGETIYVVNGADVKESSSKNNSHIKHR